MNPVMSDLAIFVASHDARIARQAAGHAARLREARAGAGQPGIVRRLASGIHAFIDPRGHALAQVRRQGRLSAAQASAVDVAPVPAVAADRVCRQIEPVPSVRTLAA